MALFLISLKNAREPTAYPRYILIKNTGWTRRLRVNNETKKDLDDFESKLRQIWRNYQK